MTRCRFPALSQDAKVGQQADQPRACCNEALLQVGSLTSRPSHVPAAL